MKRTFLSFLLLLAMISGFSARRVLYIGDSITDGGWGRSGGSAKASKDRNRLTPYQTTSLRSWKKA